MFRGFRRLRKIEKCGYQLGHVCLSVHLNRKTGLPLDGFSWNFTFDIVVRCRLDHSSFIKIRQVQRVLYMKTNRKFRSYLAKFFLEWEMLQTKFVEKIKTHILCSGTVFLKSRRLRDNVEQFCRGRQATDYNTIRRMRISFWITKATGTHSEYELLAAFRRQGWLHENASMLRLHVYCLSFKQAIISLIQLMASIHSRNTADQ
jgi:hypothetical protein